MPDIVFVVQSPTNKQYMEGIVRVNFSFKQEGLTEEKSFCIKVLVDGKSIAEESVQLSAEMQVKQMGLNTFLLAGGNTELRFQLLSDDVLLKDVAWDISVENTSNLAGKVTESFKRNNSQVVVWDDCNSTLFDYQDDQLTPWFDLDNADDYLQGRLSAGEISQFEYGLLKQFVDEGYCEIPNCFENELVDQVNQAFDEAIASNFDDYEYGKNKRIHGLHLKNASVKKLWNHPKILRILGLIFESGVRPCQTLSYVFGSEQGVHQDTIHLTPFPAGYMCGVWVSLEDVQEDSGELFVYPGTHKLPRVYRQTVNCQQVFQQQWKGFGQTVAPEWKRLLEQSNSEKIIYRPKKNTALIWHENLMHGGSRRIDEAISRRSIVSHYFAEGAAVYYDSTGLPGIVHIPEHEAEGMLNK